MTTVLTVLLSAGSFAASVATAQTYPDVRLTLNGAPAAVGSYAFPFPAGSPGLVLDNGLVRFTFNGKSATSQTILARSIVANGQEMAPLDGQNSFYVDASGGTPSLVCSQVKMLRNSPDLVEVAFVDTTTATLRPEHHLIMRRGRPGLYGYVIETANTAFTINELRVVTRWNRTLLDHVFTFERGSPDAPGTALNGQQPTSAYLDTQIDVQDSTWRIDGINNPNLPPPDSNSGNLLPGQVYTKYNWSLYHHENPFFGHFGHGYGAWFVALGGVTDQTLGAFYGVGPNHQDLAVHQDTIILNYFGANHYGLPSYPLPAGYKRLYGPWYFFVTVGDPGNPRGVIQQAHAIAQAEIAENRAGASWIADPMYPTPDQRTTVTGRLQIVDGRPVDGCWVVLSTQNVTDVYTIHEPTYFVMTDADGFFTLPGIPPAWLPGTTTPGTYTLYAFASKDSITDQYKQTGIVVSGSTTDLGTIIWAPTNHTTFLWQIGKADRKGGEFALATNPADGSNPRAYEKPSQVPGNLNFVIGSSWEPKDWYYAQTQPGTWTISFNLDRAYTGTGFLTVSSSMQQGSRPTVAINGDTADITGTLPNNNDSTITRQADRSGYPRLATLSFPASLLHAGLNTVTLTRGNGTAAGNGLGWDTFVMEVDESIAPAAAQLAGEIVATSGARGANVWRLKITNSGGGAANDVRLDGFMFRQTAGPATQPEITSRDPNVFPVPIVASIPSGGSALVDIMIDFKSPPGAAIFDVSIPFSANGGRVRGSISAAGVTAGAAVPISADQLTTTASGLVFSRATRTFNGTVTITNTTTTNVTINGPFQIVFTSLTSGVTLVGASGSFNGSAYLTVPGVATLAPGQSTTVTVQFSDPAMARINFTPVTYSGSF